MDWGSSWWNLNHYDGCDPMKLLEGLLLSSKGGKPLQFITEAFYQATCYQNRIPNMNTNIGLVFNQTTQTLPMILESWVKFTTNASQTHSSDRGSFSYSVVAIIYSVSISAVVIWFLSLFVLTNYTIKASILLKSSSLLASVYILVIIVKSVIRLHRQQKNGYLSSPELIDYLTKSTSLNVLDLIVVLLLQFNQVQVIMRIFSRQKEKRLTFIIGLIASLLSQVIWAVSKFAKFDYLDEAGDILPAFIYLVRIAMALSYAAVITVFILSKFSDVFANRSIWLLTILTLVLIFSPLALFVADVSNAFVYELSEIFSVVTYTIGVVLPWEWFNKFNLIERRKEKDGVLGRRVYEDELYELDKHEIFIENDATRYSDIRDGDDFDDNNNANNFGDGDIAENTTMLSNRSKELSNARKVLKTLRSTKKTFLTITDGIIAAGFAIPRSVSISAQSIEPVDKNAHLNDAHNLVAKPKNDPLIELNVLSNSTNNGSTSASGRHRRNVFLYSRQEVALEVSDDDDQ